LEIREKQREEERRGERREETAIIPTPVLPTGLEKKKKKKKKEKKEMWAYNIE
jgi:hypothetical protein